MQVYNYRLSYGIRPFIIEQLNFPGFVVFKHWKRFRISSNVLKVKTVAIWRIKYKKY